MEKTAKKRITRNIGGYSIVPFILFCVLLFLFSFYVIKNSLLFSETAAHNIYIADWIQEKGALHPAVADYPIYHILVRGLYALLSALFGAQSIGLDVLSCYLLALLVTVSAVIVRALLRRLVDPQTVGMDYAIDFLGISSVLFAGIGGMLTNFRYFALQGSPNSWHNPLYLTMRPFCYLSVYYFARCAEPKNDGKAQAPRLMLFVLFALLSCLAGPGYAVVYLPAFMLYSILQTIKNAGNSGSRELLGRYLQLGAACLPAAALSVVRALGGAGVAVRFGSEYSLTLIQVVLGSVSVLGLALYVYIVLDKKLCFETPLYGVCLTAMSVGWLTFFFLRGGSMVSGNYMGGYLSAAGLATVVAVTMLLKHQKKPVLRYAGIFVYVFQLIAGLEYAYRSIGTFYWI